MTQRDLSPPCGPDRVTDHLLIGNTLPLYREVLSVALQTLGPDMPVCAVAPEALDATVASLRPWMVICTALSPMVEELVPAWIVLHPDEGTHTVVSVLGERRAILHPTLDELIELVDAAWKSISG